MTTLRQALDDTGKPKDLCGMCGKAIAVRDDGLFHVHGPVNRRCAGSHDPSPHYGPHGDPR